MFDVPVELPSYNAWLPDGLDLASSLASRTGHSQPWNLGLRSARRDTFLARGGVPGGHEKALLGGVMVPFSARSRGRVGVEDRREREAGTLRGMKMLLEDAVGEAEIVVEIECE